VEYLSGLRLATSKSARRISVDENIPNVMTRCASNMQKFVARAVMATFAWKTRWHRKSWAIWLPAKSSGSCRPLAIVANRGAGLVMRSSET